jgi:hypothetical protein
MFGVAAYLTYLLMEYPRYAFSAVRYVLGRTFGDRSIRDAESARRPAGTTRWAAARAFCRGVLAYFQRGRRATAVSRRAPLLSSRT